MTREERFTDRLEYLRATERKLAGEVAQVRREEEYLLLKVRQAREQVRYYEGLLALIRRDYGRSPPLAEVVRRLE